jgi:hypothetical protein
MYTLNNMHENKHCLTVSSKNVLSAQTTSQTLHGVTEDSETGEEEQYNAHTADYEVLTNTSISCTFFGFQNGIFENVILLECSATSQGDKHPMFPGGHLHSCYR